MKRRQQRLFSRALSAHIHGRFERAETLYREVLSARPRDPEVLHQLGLVLWQQERAAEGIGFLQTAATLQPSEGRYHANLGGAYQSLGRTAEALEAYTCAVALQPDSASAWSNLGVVRRVAGDLSGAVAALQEAIKRAPDSATLWQNLGGALQAAGQLPAARTALSQAVALGQSDPESWNGLGNIELALGNLSAAARAYRKAIALRPDYPEALTNLGTALQRQGHLDEAMDLYERSIAADPQHVDAYTHFGLALQEQGALEAAAATWQRGLLVRPTPEAWLNLGNTLADLGQTQAAERALRDLVAAFPARPDAQVALAGLLAGQDQREEATECCRRALALDPDHAEAQHFLNALQGRATARAPERYVRELFDSYARRFDQHLLSTLRYCTPALLDALLPDDTRWTRAVDLGCGTGLMGQRLRARCDELIGVDLSGEMIRQAARKGLYDALHEGDIAAVLPGLGRFSLLTAADVLIYQGDLAPLMAALSAAADPSALVLLSTEHGEQAPWILQPSGRYAHHPSHVRQAAAAAGLTVRQMHSAPIRQEHGSWITGDLFLLEKTRSLSCLPDRT